MHLYDKLTFKIKSISASLSFINFNHAIEIFILSKLDKVLKNFLFHEINVVLMYTSFALKIGSIRAACNFISLVAQFC